MYFYFTIKLEIEMKKKIEKKFRQMAVVIPKHFGGLSTNPCLCLWIWLAVMIEMD